MSIHWYAHNLGDYSKNTRSLTLLEHGAYRLLLDLYYTRGGPILNDIKDIFRGCCAHTPTDRRAIEKVLKTYFQLDSAASPGFWFHKHASGEILKQNKISELRKKAAANAHAHGHANGKQTSVLNDGNLQLTTNNQFVSKDTNYNGEGKKNGNGHAKKPTTGAEEGQRIAQKYRAENFFPPVET